MEGGHLFTLTLTQDDLLRASVREAGVGRTRLLHSTGKHSNKTAPVSFAAKGSRGDEGDHLKDASVEGGR